MEWPKRQIRRTYARELFGERTTVEVPDACNVRASDGAGVAAHPRGPGHALRPEGGTAGPEGSRPATTACLSPRCARWRLCRPPGRMLPNVVADEFARRADVHSTRGDDGHIPIKQALLAPWAGVLE